eukprot:230297-Rhodomonas_salina.3
MRLAAEKFHGGVSEIVDTAKFYGSRGIRIEKRNAAGAQIRWEHMACGVRGRREATRGLHIRKSSCLGT